MKTRNIMAILLLICIGVVSCKEPSPSYIPPVETIVVVKFKKTEYKDYVLVNVVDLNKGDSISMTEYNSDFILPTSAVNLYGTSPYIELTNGYLLVDWKWYNFVSSSKQAIVKTKWVDLTDIHACWPLSEVYIEHPIEQYCVIPIGSLEIRCDGDFHWADIDISTTPITESQWNAYSESEKNDLQTLISHNDQAFAQYAEILNHMIANGEMEKFIEGE